MSEDSYYNYIGGTGSEAPVSVANTLYAPVTTDSRSPLDAGAGTYNVPANFGQNTTPIAPNGQSAATPSGLTDEYGNPISWNPNLSTATTYTNGKNAGTAVTDSSTGTTTTPTMWCTGPGSLPPNGSWKATGGHSRKATPILPSSSGSGATVPATTSSTP